MSEVEQIFNAIVTDERYLRNLDWGKPRNGHPEGTVRAHISELEENLVRLDNDSASTEYWKLRILIHVHDSFKAEATPKVAITDARSHASIARAFLEEFCSDPDLLNIVQYHDEPYALWRQAKHKGYVNQDRLSKLIENIEDWRLFLRFNAIDGVTIGKSQEPLEWAISHIAPAVGMAEEAEDVLDALRRRK